MKLPYFLIAFFEYSPPPPAPPAPATIGNPLSIPTAVNLEDEAEAGEVWSSKTD